MSSSVKHLAATELDTPNMHVPSMIVKCLNVLHAWRLHEMCAKDVAANLPHVECSETLDIMHIASMRAKGLTALRA